MKEDPQIQRLIAKVESLEQELHTTKQLLWMGMQSITWRHSTLGHAINIRNALVLIRYCLKDNSIEKINRYLEHIERQASLITDEPTLTSISSPAVSSFSINDFLRERLSQLQSDSPYKDIQIKWELESPSQFGVRANPEWLRQCIDILVENAVEAMRGSTERTLILSTITAGESVKIHITDTGVGVPSNVQPKLFREPIKGPDKRGNIGVGLLIAKTILETFEGDIQLTHSDQHGASFEITLPKA